MALCSEEHDRRLALLSQREERAEIGIGRDDCTAFIPGTLENFLIGGGLPPVIPHMDGIMPGLSQSLRKDRR